MFSSNPTQNHCSVTDPKDSPPAPPEPHLNHLQNSYRQIRTAASQQVSLKFRQTKQSRLPYPKAGDLGDGKLKRFPPTLFFLTLSLMARNEEIVFLSIGKSLQKQTGQQLSPALEVNRCAPNTSDSM